MRQMSSGCRCMITVEPGLLGGSNQTSRSAGQLGLPVDVGDDVAALVAGALQPQSGELAHPAAAAVGGHDPGGAQSCARRRRW